MTLSPKTFETHLHMKETYVLWLLNSNCMTHIVSPQRWWQMKFFAPTQLASMIYFRCFSRGRGIDGSYLLRKEGSYHLLKPQWQSKFCISSEWRLTHSSFWAIIGHLTGENGVICFGDKSKGSYHLWWQAAFIFTIHSHFQSCGG